jgi:hypothetical protein
MLAELEEAIRYKQLESKSQSRHIIQQALQDRLKLLSPTPEAFDNMMRVHALLIPAHLDVKARSRLADIARHHDREALANATLKNLIHTSMAGDGSTMIKGPAEAIFSKIRLMRLEQPEEAVRQLHHFAFGLPDSKSNRDARRLKARAFRRLGDWSSTVGENWHKNGTDALC